MTLSSGGDRDRRVQLDLFGEVAARLDAKQAGAARARVRQQLLAAFQATKNSHPGTGEHLGSRMWCGRCGAVEVNDFLFINHERLVRRLLHAVPARCTGQHLRPPQ